MKEQIENRLKGTESIINSLKQSKGLCSYLTYIIHKEFGVFEDNYAINFIIGTLIEHQILDYYKLMKKDEKHSFQKLLNLGFQNNNAKLDNLQQELSKLTLYYTSNDFEKIRSKYLAHLDLNLSIAKTDLVSILSFSSNCIDYFILLCNEFKYKRKKTKNINKSFDEIIIELRRLETIKAYSFVNFLEKKRTIKINELIKIFNDPIK